MSTSSAATQAAAAAGKKSKASVSFRSPATVVASSSSASASSPQRKSKAALRSAVALGFIDASIEKTNVVEVSEDNLKDLVKLIPSTRVGHHVWLVLELTLRGAVCSAKIYDGGSLDDIDPTEGQSVDPRSAARLVHFVDGFQTEGLRHLSVSATHAMHSEGPLADGDDATVVTRKQAPPVIPVQRANDDSLLQKLEGFVSSSSFTEAAGSFAAEHAHKFKPLSNEDEFPLHYQELHLRFQAVLEAELESLLREHGSSASHLMEVVGRAKERGDQLECIDVLLSSTSFSAFVELMLDYKFGLYAEREISPQSVFEG